MTDNELHKLSKKKLIKLITQQNTEIKELQNELNKKKILINVSGSLAEATLKLNGVFDAAQKAADQYIENILSRDMNASDIESAAKLKAENIIKEAREKSEKIINEAQSKAKYISEFDPDNTGIIWS